MSQKLQNCLSALTNSSLFKRHPEVLPGEFLSSLTSKTQGLRVLKSHISETKKHLELARTNRDSNKETPKPNAKETANKPGPVREKPPVKDAGPKTKGPTSSVTKVKEEAAPVKEEKAPEVPVKAHPSTKDASKSGPRVETAKAPPDAPTEKEQGKKGQSEFETHLRKETGGKWKDEEYERAAKFHETGDKSLMKDFSGLKQGIAERESTKFKASSPEEAKRINESEARKVGGNTITSKDGTKFRYAPDPAYKETEGQGDEIHDLEPDKEDPETGEKASYAVAGNSVNQPEPTEKHPFVYKLHGLFNTLPSGKEQFAGATIGENGNISKDVWNSKTKNISKEEKGLYESLVPEAFKGDKVNVRMLNESLKDLPSVEVRTYGMEPKEDTQKTALDKLTHEWFDNLDNDTYNKVVDYTHLGEESALYGLDQDTIDTAKEFKKLTDEFEEFGGDRNSGPRATSYYKSISPFDTEKYPVQRIDVVLPTKDGLKDLKPIRGVNMEDQERAKGLLWAPDNLHENLPNTLGWVMAQYVPHPETGEKTMFIGEMQSEWAKAKYKDSVGDKGYRGYTPEQDHPLLKSWESLALKAAIDTARREGVSKVILSDAESAMMTEGHDKQVNVPGVGFPMSPEEARAAGHDPSKLKTSQDSGMRAQYDKRGPDILRKITGDAGREVDMGVHKNAVEKPPSGLVDRMPFEGINSRTGEVIHGNSREDVERRITSRTRVNDIQDWSIQENPRLQNVGKVVGSPVFNTEEGTPRTNAKGREYDISNLSDTANQYSSRSGLGVAPEAARRAISDFTDRNPYLRGKIILHTGPEDLSAYAKEHPESKRVMDQTLDLMGQGAKISGFVDTQGRIHVFSPNAPPSPKALERLLAHEVFHRGEEYARVYAPKEYDDLQKAKSLITDTHLSELGDGDYSKILPDWRTDKKQRAELQTEWITRRIEQGALDTAPPDSAWGRIVSALKAIWRKVTGNKNPTDQQIQEMYRAMTKVQESGRPSPKEPFEPKFSDKQAAFRAAVGGQVTQIKDRLGEYKDKSVDEISRSFSGAARHGLDAAKSVLKAGSGLSKFTEPKKALGEMQGGIAADGTNTSARQEALEKAIPLERRQNAITIYREAGDIAASSGRSVNAVLKDWETRAKGKNKLFDRAVSEAQTLTPEEIQHADLVSDYYDEGAQLGYSTGHLGEDVILDGSKSYANHLWELPTSKSGKDAYAQIVSKMQRNFKFGNKAKHGTFFDGVMAGLAPKTLSAPKLLGVYENHLDTTIRHNQLLKSWANAKMPDGKPMMILKGADVTSDPLKGGSKVLDPTVAKRILDADGEAIPYKTHPDPRLWGWKWMGQDAKGQDVMMKGNFAIHPEAYDMVNSLLGTSALKDWAHSPSQSAATEIAKTGFRIVDTLNMMAKEGMFGLSAFHIVREGTQALGHRVNPLTNLHDFNPQNDVHMDAVNHGLTLPGTGGSNNKAMEGITGGNGWLKKIPVIGDLAKITSDFTWKYVRQLKLKAYEKLLPQYLERFKPELDAKKLSIGDVKHKLATDMNDSFGGQNVQMLGTSPTVQHIMSLALTAPDFFMSNLKSTISAVGGAVGAKGGREQALATAALAIGSYAVARALNAALNDGDTKMDHPFSVVHGNREYTMKTLPEDVYRFATQPRQFAMNRLSPITSKPAIELLTGKNYRGEKMSPLETMKDAALAGLPMSMRFLPGLRQLTASTANNPISPIEGMMGTLGMHISKFSPVNKAYDIANAYKVSIGKEDTGVYPVSQYSPLKNALEDLDTDKVRSEVAKMKQTMKPDALAKAVHESIFHSWMTTTKDTEAFQKYLKGDPEKKAIVSAAESRKKDMWRRFVKLTGYGRDMPVGMPVPRH